LADRPWAIDTGYYHYITLSVSTSSPAIGTTIDGTWSGRNRCVMSSRARPDSREFHRDPNALRRAWGRTRLLHVIVDVTHPGRAAADRASEPVGFTGTAQVGRRGDRLEAGPLTIARVGLTRRSRLAGGQSGSTNAIHSGMLLIPSSEHSRAPSVGRSGRGPRDAAARVNRGPLRANRVRR